MFGWMQGEPHMDGEPGDLVLNIRTYPHRNIQIITIIGLNGA